MKVREDAPAPKADAKPAKMSLLAADRAAHVIRANSLPASAFDAGVLNLVLASWLFGAYPEHYWVLYLLEFPVLTFIVALKFRKAKIVRSDQLS